MARPTTRQPDFAYRIASYQLGAGSPDALERLDPSKFTVLNLDPRWAFYPRTLIQRGELHEQIGEPALADSIYRRVLELWKDADARGQPLVRQAQGRLSALRDAPASVPVVPRRQDSSARRTLTTLSGMTARRIQ